MGRPRCKRSAVPAICSRVNQVPLRPEKRRLRPLSTAVAPRKIGGALFKPCMSSGGRRGLEIELVRRASRGPRPRGAIASNQPLLDNTHHHDRQ